MVLIVAILGLAVIVWGGVFFRWAGLFPACLLTLFLGICLGSEFFHRSVITLDRAWWGITCIAFGLYRFYGGTRRVAWNADDLLTLGFLGVLLWSTFTHDWRWQERLPLSRLLFYYFLPWTMYVVARELPLERRSLITAYGAIALFGVYLGLTAVAEVRQWYGLVFPRYIASPQHLEFLGRGRGPLLNPSGNGVILSVCLFALWMCWPHGGVRTRWAVLLGTGCLGLGVLATLTRCVWMGAALGGVIIMACVLPPRWRIPCLVSILLVGSGTVVAKWQSLTAFKRDKNVSVADMKKSASLRPILAYVAWQMFQDYPLTGVGFGQYKHVDKYYLGDRSTSMILEEVRPYHQHNIFLSLLTETGLIGMSLYVAMLTRWSFSSWHLWSDQMRELPQRQLGLWFLASLAAFLVNGMFQDLTIVPMMHQVLFFLAGLVVGQVAASDRSVARLAWPDNFSHDGPQQRRSPASALS